jgi:hypothetical protein
MLQIEVLISKVASTVDASRSSTVAIEEISPLDHEAFDLVEQVSTASSVNTSNRIYPWRDPLWSKLTTRWKRQFL